MKVEIKCTGTDEIEIDKLKDFQGDLKKISNENLIKLKDSILVNGFTAPVFVWKKGNTHYIIDGHQRIKALQVLKEEGCEIGKLPIIYIKAKDNNDAKKKLLYITSQYGEFVSSEFFDFVLNLDGIDNIRLTNEELNLTGINTEDLDKFFEEENAENMGLKEKLCPHCGGIL